ATTTETKSRRHKPHRRTQRIRRHRPHRHAGRTRLLPQRRHFTDGATEALALVEESSTLRAAGFIPAGINPAARATIYSSGSTVPRICGNSGNSSANAAAGITTTAE